jgi:hypothetical protein
MPAGMNRLDQRLNQASGQVNELQQVADHLDYGIITDVDFDSYQVQVQLHGSDRTNVLGKAFWPLITQREMIFMLWGQLRKGMAVRVHWRGQPDRATWALVEIVGDENANFLKQLDMDNEAETAAHKIFQGGLIPI